MTNRERFLAGEVFTVGYGATLYRFDECLDEPGLENRVSDGSFHYFTLIKIGVTQVKWHKLILGKWINGSFKFTELKFLSDSVKGGATE